MDDWLDRILAQVDQRSLFLLGVALLALLALAGFLYGIKPAWKELDAVQDRRESAQAGLPEGGGGEARIADLQRRVDELRTELEGGAAGVPRAQIESFVVDALDRLSGEHTVALRSITPDEADRLWMFEELPYTVEVTGGYFSLHRWLHDLERELRPMVVKQFTIQPAREEQHVLMNLRIVAYRPARERA